MKKLYLLLAVYLAIGVCFSCATKPDNANVGGVTNRNVSAAAASAIPSVPAPAVPNELTEELEEVLISVCIHDNDSSFHNCEVVYAYLERENSEDEFYKWRDDILTKSIAKNDPSCTYLLFNIYDCLKYFDVPRDFFEEYYSNYLYVYGDFDIELLYNGKREDVFEYYYDLEARYITFHKKGSDQLLKIHMIAVMDMFDKFSTAVNTFSIPEFIYVTGMTIDQFYLAKERVIKNQTVEDIVYDYSREELFYEYNIKDVYENREYYESLVGKFKPYHIDEMIRR